MLGFKVLKRILRLEFGGMDMNIFIVLGLGLEV